MDGHDGHAVCGRRVQCAVSRPVECKQPEAANDYGGQCPIVRLASAMAAVRTATIRGADHSSCNSDAYCFTKPNALVGRDRDEFEAGLFRRLTVKRDRLK